MTNAVRNFDFSDHLAIFLSNHCLDLRAGPQMSQVSEAKDSVAQMV
jgi:hypothetical protein